MMQQYETSIGAIVVGADKVTKDGLMMKVTEEGIERDQPSIFEAGDQIYFFKPYALGEEIKYITILRAIGETPGEV